MFVGRHILGFGTMIYDVFKVTQLQRLPPRSESWTSAQMGLPPTLHTTFYTLHFTHYTLHSALHTLHCTLYTLPLPPGISIHLQPSQASPQRARPSHALLHITLYTYTPRPGTPIRTMYFLFPFPFPLIFSSSSIAFLMF